MQLHVVRENVIDLFVVSAIALDEYNGFIYWGDNSIIKQATLSGTYLKDVFDTSKLNKM